MPTSLYIITKKVHNITYKWNDQYKWWEGFSGNESLLTEEEFNKIWEKLNSWEKYPEQLSFIKIN